MTTIDTLRSLQKRIREATGPDRELDWLILSNVSMPWLADKARSWLDDQYVDADGRISDPEEICWISWEDGKRRYEHCPHFTTDPDGLGACVALLNAVLPGWHWGISGNRSDPRGACVASVHVPFGYEGKAPWPEGVAHNNNACLAILDAIIAARIAVIAEEEARERVG